jgi:hypothetical protein
MSFKILNLLSCNGKCQERSRQNRENPDPSLLQALAIINQRRAAYIIRVQ